MYIAGGFNGQECLSSAESYNPSTNQWTLIQGMRNRRSGVGVIAHENCIYAIGGFNGITRMNNGERYNPQTNQWTNIAEMYSPRSNFGIEVRTYIADLSCSTGLSLNSRHFIQSFKKSLTWIIPTVGEVPLLGTALIVLRTQDLL